MKAEFMIPICNVLNDQLIGILELKYNHHYKNDKIGKKPFLSYHFDEFLSLLMWTSSQRIKIFIKEAKILSESFHSIYSDVSRVMAFH